MVVWALRCIDRARVAPRLKSLSACKSMMEGKVGRIPQCMGSLMAAYPSALQYTDRAKAVQRSSSS